MFEISLTNWLLISISTGLLFVGLTIIYAADNKKKSH